ncbi:MAG: chromate efflux transporter [Nitratireductor sp.]
MSNSNEAATNATPSLLEATKIWFKIGLLSFGGPAAQIALMHKMLVDERKWLSENQFLSALSFCMLLPGPEAMQLATFSGWRLHGVLGGLIAGLLFVLPGAVVIFALAALYVTYGNLPFIDTLFLGVQAVAVVIVIEALVKVSKRALKEPSHWFIAGLSFIALFLFSVPFPIIILAAAIYGGLWGAHKTKDNTLAPKVSASLTQTLKTLLIGLCIWVLPILAIDSIFEGAILTQIAIFFSKLALVTFGGAYAVLAYMAQSAVEDFGWLSAAQMLDGLGLAETTPGPLILVTQFVGFLAAFGEGGYALAFAGGLTTLWVTFVPCFIFIFMGAPYLEWVSAQPRLEGALRAITASVVGVILNLSLWFALHVVFQEVIKTQFGALKLWVPQLSTFNSLAIGLIALSFVLLIVRHMAIGWVLLICALCACAACYLGFVT